MGGMSGWPSSAPQPGMPMRTPSFGMDLMRNK
jgi:hypothetical protein